MTSSLLAAIQIGSYVSPWKALAIIIPLIIWVKLLAWIDKDTGIARLNREGVNSGMFVGLLGGYLLFFLLPGFLVGYLVLLLFFAADIGTYLGIRAKVVGLADLKDELRQWWRGILAKAQRKKTIAAEAGQVLIIDKSGAPQPPPESDSPDRVPYDAAQKLLTKPLKVNAEQIDLVAGEPAVVTYYVDGVRYEGESLDHNSAGAAVQYLKRMAGLDMNERRKPQTGNFKAGIDGQKRPLQLTTRGSTAGESARFITDVKNRQNFKLDALGFTEDQLQIVRDSMNEGGGIVLLAAPKGQGLTSLAYGILRAHDAFMFHLQTVERGSEMDLEGITQNNLPANASGAEEAKQIIWVVSQEPDILMVTSIEDTNSAQALAKFANEKKRAYVCLRAPNTFEAIRQWRKLVGDDALAMKQLKLVIAGRLARRLCSACKVGYTPDPTQLRKLNMSPDAVGKLYLARKEPMRDSKGNAVPCIFCNDLAFKGRFGVYELFPIDDEVRKIVQAGGSDNQLKQAFRKLRGRLLQEVALSQVQAGETSVEEVLRILKGDSSSQAPPGGGSGPGPGGEAPPKSPKPAPAQRGPNRSRNSSSVFHRIVIMIFSLLLIIITLTVAFFHYIQGLFSATISAILVVIAAVLAVGLHENLASHFVNSMPEAANSLAIVLIFAAAYIIPRLIIDAFVPGNVRYPVILDKAGAGIMGLICGLFAAGIVGIAAESLPFGPTVGLYSRYDVADREGLSPGLRGQLQDTASFDVLIPDSITPDEALHVWGHQDDLTFSFVQKVSDSGSMAGDRPISTIHPDLLDELYGQRLGIQVGLSHTLISTDANPAVTVEGVYTQPKLAQVDGEIAGVNANLHLRAIPIKPILAPGGGQTILIVRTVFNAADTKAIADKVDNIVRLSMGSICLTAGHQTDAGVDFKDFWPVATLDPRNIAVGSRVDDFLFTTLDASRTIDFVFVVDDDYVFTGDHRKDDKTGMFSADKPPQIADGAFITIKRYTHLDLSGKKVEYGPLNYPDATPIIRKGDVAAAIAAAKPIPLAIVDNGSAKTGPVKNQSGGAGIGDTGALFQTIAVSSKLFSGIDVASGNPAGNFKKKGVKGDWADKKWQHLTVAVGSTLDQLASPGDDKIADMAVPDGSVMVQVHCTAPKSGDNLWAWADKVSDCQLADAAGNTFKPVGFWVNAQKGTNHYMAATFGGDLKLPDTSGRPTDFWIAYYVPAGTAISEFRFGTTAVQSALNFKAQ